MTGTFVDYALPSAADVPSFETDRTETPSPVNSLGVKGVGEAGTIAASPAITNAVIDALRPLGVTYINMPLSPMRVWADAIAGGADGTAGGRCRHDPRRVRLRRRPSRSTRRWRALRDGGEDAKLLAGGHSLLPLMKLRLAAPTLLVDLRRVPGLTGIQRENGDRPDRRDDDATTTSRPAASAWPSTAAATIADQQVRNRGHDRRHARARRPGLRPAGDPARRTRAP